MEQFVFHRALQAVWEVIGQANKYIVNNAPWELAKKPGQVERLATVLYHLLETLRLLTVALQPIMPGTAAKMAAALGTTLPAGFQRQGQWGLLPPGTILSPVPALFPRLEKGTKSQSRTVAKNQAPAASKSTAAKKALQEEGLLLTFEEFSRLDLRIGEIVAAEKIAKSDRLLNLTVKAPEERTVVAGIAGHYTPEEIIGRQVILVANLKPTKLMGVLSEGMVLAAKEGDRLVLAGPMAPVAPGSKVS
jgi:methionyl-tRNA synthetase